MQIGDCCDCPGSTGTFTCNVGCCTDAPGDSADVNLGIGGLSADDCEGAACGNIQGIYTATWRGLIPQCTWRYEASGYCDSTCGAGSGGCGATYALLVEVRINAVSCKIEATVSLTMTSDGTCACDTSAGATYRSASAPTSCVGVFTLDKLTEDWEDACGGSLPETITVTF